MSTLSRGVQVAPYLTVLLLMTAVGLLGISLPVYLLGHKPDSIGLVMAAYSVGLFCGGLAAPKLRNRFPCRRIFVASCSLFALGAICHSLTSDWTALFLLRTASGFLAAISLILLESRITGGALASRARMLATYQWLVVLGLGIGQLLIRLGNANISHGFLYAGALTLLASLCATQVSRPCCQHKQVDQQSPQCARPATAAYGGLIAAACAGLLISALFGMLPVALNLLGAENEQLGLNMALLVLSGLLLQHPAAQAAKHWGRAPVLAIVLLLLTFELTGLLSGRFSALSPMHMVILGSLIAPIYPLGLGLWSDHGGNVGGRLMAAYAMGGFLGPLGVSACISHWGARGLFMFAGATTLLTFAMLSVLYLFLLGRIFSRGNSAVAKNSMPARELY